MVLSLLELRMSACYASKPPMSRTWGEMLEYDAKKYNFNVLGLPGYDRIDMQAHMNLNNVHKRTVPQANRNRHACNGVVYGIRGPVKCCVHGCVGDCAFYDNS